jgi:hypothetical protein
MPYSQEAPRTSILGSPLPIYVTENTMDNLKAVSTAEHRLDSKLPAVVSIGVSVPVNIETLRGG